MALPKRTRKKTVRARRRTGADGAPAEKGWVAVEYYFQNEVDRKEGINIVKAYVKKNFTKPEAKNILEHNDQMIFGTYAHSAIAWYSMNAELNCEKSKYWQSALNKRLTAMIESGKMMAKQKRKVEKVGNVITLTPQQRLQNKISNTIMQDLLDLEDAWIDGERATIDVYALFKKHGLAGSAIAPVKKVIEGWLTDYDDAYNKKCDQAVEGYSHLKRVELRHRLQACQDMLLDLDRIKSAAKATRKTRVKKPMAADKQVKNMKYKTEDATFKLVSISPSQIVGKIRLYTFNTKTRILAEYLTQSVNGFEVSGTSIKNFDKANSRQVKLRKPEEFLPEIFDRTPKQISKAWSDLTTKSSVPNGRINADTILLRVLDK